MPPLPYRGPSSQRHGQNAIRCLSTAVVLILKMRELA